MQIVIDMPESIKQKISQMGLNRLIPEDINVVSRSIGRGIALPEGHGRLIDATELLEEVDEYIKGLKELHDWGRVLGVEGARSIINHAPTVLEPGTETETN